LLLEEDGAARRFHQQRLGQDAGQSKHALRGAAVPLFLFGGALKGGLVGKHPSLTKLERGDLVHHTDFRSVYATLLEHWLHTPPAPVLGRQFGRLDLLRT